MESSFLIEVDNTSTIRTGALHCYHYTLTPLPASRLLFPRSGLERSDFVRWPFAAGRTAARPRSLCEQSRHGIVASPYLPFARLICPPGRRREFVSSPARENFLLSRISNLPYCRYIPPRLHRGVSRSSRNARRNAVDARCADRRAARSRTAKSCGPGAPKQALSRRGCLAHRADDGGNQAGSPGRARSKPSNHCAGEAGVIRRHLRSSRFRAIFRAGATGVWRTPGLPCALDLSREKVFEITPGADRAAGMRRRVFLAAV